MITADKVSADKLRGGFYTPSALVRVCLDRVASLTSDGRSLRVLEPSAGDGGFLTGLKNHALADRVDWVTSVEIDPVEADKCRASFSLTDFAGEVVGDSVLAWAEQSPRQFDIAVGNPPFVRFQFISPAEKQRAAAALARFSIQASSVSNLWLSVFMSAMGKLVPGGSFAFILPAEALMGVSAQGVRTWLLAECSNVSIDVFPPGSYPDVLQEVVVLSGRRTLSGEKSNHTLHVTEHDKAGLSDWTHIVKSTSRTWTRYLLNPEQVAALEYASSLSDVVPLRELASFTVSTVTGANGYFCVNSDQLEENGLEEWAIPLLPRTRHAPGLDFTQFEHDILAKSDINTWMLHFAADKADPRSSKRPAKYIETGEAQELNTRYKCRIRAPWFRVPVVAPGPLLLAKRCHNYPRVILNSASVYTTDTIYRGILTPGSKVSARDFAASFHNSLTLLTAEIEGRSFGGGVLELVPSEIGRLTMPVAPGIGEQLQQLDQLARSLSTPEDDRLVASTDDLVASTVEGLDADLMATLRVARKELLTRRLNRN